MRQRVLARLVLPLAAATTAAVAAVTLAAILLGVAPPADSAPRWGWLGVRIRDLSEQEMDEISQKHGLREGFGAMIVEVLKETPAETSGLRTGDVVVAFRDRPVVDTRSLQRYIASTNVGEKVPITVLRKNEGRRPVTVSIGLMPDTVAAERVAAEFGFFVRETEASGDLGPPRRVAGAPPTVAGVLPRSRAEAAGLQAGDVLVEVNGRGVETITAVHEALLGVTVDSPLSLVVRRDRERVAVRIAGLPAR
jgi:serine protease Do